MMDDFFGEDQILGDEWLEDVALLFRDEELTGDDHSQDNLSFTDEILGNNEISIVNPAVIQNDQTNAPLSPSNSESGSSPQRSPPQMRIRFQDTFTQPVPVSLLPAQHQLVECYQQQRQNNWPIIQLVRTPTEQEMEGKWFYDTFRTAFPTLITLSNKGENNRVVGKRFHYNVLLGYKWYSICMLVPNAEALAHNQLQPGVFIQEWTECDTPKVLRPHKLAKSKKHKLASKADKEIARAIEAVRITTGVTIPHPTSAAPSSSASSPLPVGHGVAPATTVTSSGMQIHMNAANSNNSSSRQDRHIRSSSPSGAQSVSSLSSSGSSSSQSVKIRNNVHSNAGAALSTEVSAHRYQADIRPDFQGSGQRAAHRPAAVLVGDEIFDQLSEDHNQDMCVDWGAEQSDAASTVTEMVKQPVVYADAPAQPAGPPSAHSSRVPVVIPRPVSISHVSQRRPSRPDYGDQSIQLPRVTVLDIRMAAAEAIVKGTGDRNDSELTMLAYEHDHVEFALGASFSSRSERMTQDNSDEEPATVQENMSGQKRKAHIDADELGDPAAMARRAAQGVAGAAAQGTLSTGAAEVTVQTIGQGAKYMRYAKGGAHAATRTGAQVAATGGSHAVLAGAAQASLGVAVTSLLIGLAAIVPDIIRHQKGHINDAEFKQRLRGHAEIIGRDVTGSTLGAALLALAIPGSMTAVILGSFLGSLAATAVHALSRQKDSAADSSSVDGAGVDKNKDKDIGKDEEEAVAQLEVKLTSLEICEVPPTASAEAPREQKVGAEPSADGSPPWLRTAYARARRVLGWSQQVEARAEEQGTPAPTEACANENQDLISSLDAREAVTDAAPAGQDLTDEPEQASVDLASAEIGIDDAGDGAHLQLHLCTVTQEGGAVEEVWVDFDAWVTAVADAVEAEGGQAGAASCESSDGGAAPQSESAERGCEEQSGDGGDGDELCPLAELSPAGSVSGGSDSGAVVADSTDAANAASITASARDTVQPAQGVDLAGRIWSLLLSALTAQPAQPSVTGDSALAVESAAVFAVLTAEAGTTGTPPDTAQLQSTPSVPTAAAARSPASTDVEASMEGPAPAAEHNEVALAVGGETAVTGPLTSTDTAPAPAPQAAAAQPPSEPAADPATDSLQPALASESGPVRRSWYSPLMAVLSLHSLPSTTETSVPPSVEPREVGEPAAAEESTCAPTTTTETVVKGEACAVAGDQVVGKDRAMSWEVVEVVVEERDGADFEGPVGKAEAVSVQEHKGYS